MVCSAEAYQLLQMLPQRLDLKAEKSMETPLTEHVCSEDPVLLEGSSGCLLTHELVSMEGCFGSASVGGRGG